MLSMSNGVIYIASGNSYLEQAAESAKSVKKHNPDIQTTLFTDEHYSSDYFDSVITQKERLSAKGDSILKHHHFIYDKNIYLDADTRVCDDITGLFELLDKHHIAAAHNEARSWYHSEVYEENNIDIPDAFPEYNTGVLAFRDSNKVRKFFKNWSDHYSSIDYNRNQPSFRTALYQNEIKIATLPPEYNFMTHTIGFASGDVKILHQGTSNEDLSEWEDILNSVSGKKVTTWERYPCRVVPNSYQSRRYQLEKLDEISIFDLIKRSNKKRKTEGNVSLIKHGFNKAIEFISGK